MTLLLLLAALANGGEITGPFRAGDTAVAVEKSWLLPDAHYDACLVKAKDAGDLLVRLETCTERGLAELDRCDRALTICDKAMSTVLGQFDIDTEAVNQLTQTVIGLESDLAMEQITKAKLRAQRNTAWTVTGSVLVTLGAAAAVAGIARKP